MPSLTVTAKGRITLRRELLRHLGVVPGQKVQPVEMLADGSLALQAAQPQGRDAFVGCLPKPERALSVQERNAAIADGWAGRR
ncbi:MAG: AbrB/MazE/SpoVT family DNA-binding domain-containing protein [Burkholderiaceae bacterium]|nr:AbrB/MazE/SpoVT family DNA-binding domain-containing protein [Burkholderiaceae bacterium]